MWITEDIAAIQRWYKETVKQPLAGDKIKVITDLYEEDGIALGSIHEINQAGSVLIETEGDSNFLHETEFVVLEKTNTLKIDGKEYEETPEVKVGGEILILRSSERKGYKAGDILTLEKIEGEMFSARNKEGEVVNVWLGEFTGLEPFTEKGSVERRVLERFDEVEKSILASDISLGDAFELILKFQNMKFWKKRKED